MLVGLATMFNSYITPPHYILSVSAIRWINIMTTKEQLIKDFSLFVTGNEGIESWVSKQSNESIIDRLAKIEQEPLNKVQLNQLLVLAQERAISDDYYNYYWFTKPDSHPYDVTKLPGFDELFLKNKPTINSLDHLKWGLYRIYTDGLLFFGNVRYSFKQLSSMNDEELTRFFHSKRVDTDSIKNRGPAINLQQISKDNRYLISEMACKSYGDTPTSQSDLRDALIDAWKNHETTGGGKTLIRNLLDGSYVRLRYSSQNQMWLFSADDILDQEVSSLDELEQKYSKVAEAFIQARNAALKNTELYLSVVNDLDVYVATSMRSREDFRKMASDCESIFSDTKLQSLHIRYFDPTLSAAEGHQDKGLIECLMVKCAKVLVYCAGEKESYGKDAEAAMALSLGKTVIFYCNHEQRMKFYRDVHPLSRLIDFQTGVATGAIVTDQISEVSELLSRMFENRLEYILEQPKPGYLQLKESITNSVVRLQTNNRLLSKAFWNYYNVAR